MSDNKSFCVESNCDNYINGECVVDSEVCQTGERNTGTEERKWKQESEESL